MGSEELGEQKQVNHTPTIALGIAALLLLIVGAMSYRDYVRRSLEKEYAEKEKVMMERAGYVPVGTTNTPYIHQSQLAQQGQTQAQQPVTPATVPAVTAAQNPVTTGAAATAQPANTQPAGSNIAAVDPQRFPEQSNLPVPNDPEIQAMRNSLDEVKKQAEATANRYGELAGNSATALQDSASRAGNSASAAITEELPDFLRNATENPPGGNPEVNERLARLKQQVRVAPSLGKIISYDNSWGIVVFDAGSDNGVKKDERFAVRRGDDILGWVKVDEVEKTQAIARLVTKNRDSDTDLKPEAGDDLIAFELY